jgi:hypothetical protein
MATATGQRVPDDALAVAQAVGTLVREDDGTYRFGTDLAALGIDGGVRERLELALAAVNDCVVNGQLSAADANAVNPVVPTGVQASPGDVATSETVLAWYVTPKSNATGLSGALYALGVTVTVAGLAVAIAFWGCPPAAVAGMSLAIFGAGCIVVATLIAWNAGDDGVLITADTDRVTVHVFPLP